MSFAIHRKLVPSLVEFLKCFNEHLMTLFLHLHGSCCATVVSIYASKLDSDEFVIAQFYESLRGEVNWCLWGDKIILLVELVQIEKLGAFLVDMALRKLTPMFYSL